MLRGFRLGALVDWGFVLTLTRSCVRKANMLGSWRRPDPTAQTIRDGWMWTRATSKILKRELRAPYWQERNRWV